MSRPPINPDHVRRRRRRVQKALKQYADSVCTRGALASMVPDLLRALGPKVRHDAVAGSCDYLLGETLTGRVLGRLAWRLAGNRERLCRGVPTPPEVPLRRKEAALVKIVGCRRFRYRSQTPGIALSLQFETGTLCPSVLQVDWPASIVARFCRDRSGGLGFSRPDGPLPYLDPAQTYGLYALALLDPAKVVENAKRPPVVGLVGSAGLVRRNRKILSMRNRVDFECPKSFKHPCHRCHVGADQCPAATHALSYERVECRGCGKSSWKEAGKRSAYCAECEDKFT